MKLTPQDEPPFRPAKKPLLIVLSGPSGVGKDAILNKLKESGYPLKFITTVTTRPRRSNERDGIDYHFVSRARFKKMIENSELLERASVYGHWYGVPKETVKEALAKGEDVIVKVDVQGATTIKKILPEAILIFLMPPSLEELARRLTQRYTESPPELRRRLKTAEDEIAKLSLFDYVVVNRQGEIEAAVAEITAVITAEKCRVVPRETPLS